MDHREFRAFVQQMRQWLIDKHRSDYKVGAALSRIRSENLWERWPRDDQHEPGYATFSEFCDRELGYSQSQAHQKAHNFEALVAIGLVEEDDTFSRCMRLGWSKLNVVLRVARDQRSLVAWLNDIEGKNLSEMQLRSRIEAARAHHLGIVDGRAPAAPTTEEARATVIGGGSLRPAPEPPAPRGRRGGADQAPTTAGYVGYEVRFESQAALDAFTRAVDMIRRRYGNVGMGRSIEMMAVQYMATVPTTAQGGATIEVENLLRTIESGYGVKLAVVQPAAPASRRKTSKALRAIRDGSR